MEGDPAAAPAAAPPQPVKRKRGRPRKSETQSTSTQTPNPGGGPGLTLKPKKQRKRKADGNTSGPPPSSVDVSMIGQQVSGVLEGTFDAGYLLSVRVGNSDTILRGVVFGPGLSVPLSKLNDVAPGVKQVRREEKLLPILPAVKPTPPAPAPTAAQAQAHGQAPKQTLHVFPPPLSFMVPPHSNLAAPPTSAVLESAAALFGNSIQAPAAPAPPSTGLVAALQQLPGGGYTPDPATFAFQPESVKSL